MIESLLPSFAGFKTIDYYAKKSNAEETWEAQQGKTREIMIIDIVKSIKLDREKMEKDPFLEPFNFEDLVNSTKKNIWIGESELRLMCAEAWFRLLDGRDYRYGNKPLFIESLREVKE